MYPNCKDWVGVFFMESGRKGGWEEGGGGGGKGGNCWKPFTVVSMSCTAHITYLGLRAKLDSLTSTTFPAPDTTVPGTAVPLAECECNTQGHTLLLCLVNLSDFYFSMTVDTTCRSP